jgi:DNA-3-methyladenine glycosylase
MAWFSYAHISNQCSRHPYPRGFTPYDRSGVQTKATSETWSDPPCGPVVSQEFFARSALEVAPELLGKLVVRRRGDDVQWGRLVEVEAYCGPHDLAAHSSRGLTPRTRTMFGPPGRAYVYLIYGIHHCLNFVCQPEGLPEAILVRALAPGPRTGRCSGPGLVCRALDIDRQLDGAALAPPSLYLVDDGWRPEEVIQAPRIGVDYAGDWRHRPWRYLLDSPHVSKRPPRGNSSGSL